jgi:PAS domain-containing protein
MVRAPADQAHSGKTAQNLPAAYESFVDPGHAGDQPSVLALLSGILQAPTDYAIFATDPDGAILLWTEGAARLFGEEPRAVLGKLTFGDLCATAAPEQEPAAGAAGAEPAAGESPLAAARRNGAWRGTFRRERASGERFTARAIVTPLGEAGQPAGYVVLSWDVSVEMSRVK